MGHFRGTERLGGVDAAWLHMEDPTNPMVVTALLELAGKPDPRRLTALLERLVESAPRFRSRVVEPRLGLDVPHWEVLPGFRASANIEFRTLGPGDAALRRFVSERVSTLLDRDQPLWRLYVLDRGRGGTAVLCRIHHAIADGFALLAVLLSLCDGDAPVRGPAATHGWSAGSVLREAASLTRMATLPHDPATVLKHPLGPTKRVAWSRPFPLDRVKVLARRLGATVNDVLVAAVAGAVRAQLAAHGQHVDEVRAMVPVNLRTRPVSTAELGNEFGLVILGLPVGVADPVERVRETSRRMMRLKASPEALVAKQVLRVMGWAPALVEELGVAFFARKASLVLTNVPGPREPLSLAGLPVKRLLFWVPQSGRMGLGVSLFSYAGQVTVGVMADAHVLEEPQGLVDDLTRELRRLEVASSATAPRAARTSGPARTPREKAEARPPRTKATVPVGRAPRTDRA
jgi:hypothetical protein